MRILISNDDGIKSPSLLQLTKWAMKLGEVTIVAPKTEQSGKSQSIDFCGKIEVREVDLIPGVKAYSVDSTPADCVRFATAGLDTTYDLILSGINRGYNLGEDIVYSGTLGAVWEASRLGIRGLAISTDLPTFESAHIYLDEIYDFICSNKLFDQSIIYNINIPTEVCGIRITRQGGIYYSDKFVYCGNDMYVQEGAPIMYDTNDPDIDIDAVRSNYISVTPISVSRTDRVAYDILRGKVKAIKL